MNQPAAAPGGTVDYLPLYRRCRILTFALTWLAYAAYYLCRTNYSIVKGAVAAEFGFDTLRLGTIDTAYLTLYAVGQFVNGVVGDRIGGRLLVASGLFATAALNLTFGLGGGYTLFLVAYALNGWAQSAGWPGCAKSVAQWYAVQERGTVMGFWCTCYQVGSVGSAFLATWLLVHHGWRMAWIVPAVAVGAYALVFLRFQCKSPEGEGLPDVETYVAARSGRAPVQTPDASDRGSWRDTLVVLRSREIWTLGLTYVFLKFVRYSFLFWLPFYMARVLGYKAGEAGYTSVVFDLAGIGGAVFAGVISDRMFHGRRAPIVVVMMSLLAVAAYFYGSVSALGRVPNIAAIAVIGFLIYGPDTVASGAGSVDFGTKRAAAAAAGFVNGLGSIGAAFSGVAIGYVSRTYGWTAVFNLFAPLSLAGALLMATMWNSRARA